MITKGRIAGAATAIILALGLSGCDTPPTGPDLTLEQRYPIAVEPRAVYLELAVGGDRRPHWGDERAIRSFVAEWVEAGHGPLIVAGADATTAERTRQVVARIAGEQRGNPSSVRTTSRRVTTPQGTGGAVLAFRRLTAVPPECAPEIATLEDSRNTRTSVLGCASRRNLAAMVADPADLVAPAIPSGPAFAARRALVIEKWRKGEATPAATPEAEANTIDFVSTVLGGGGGEGGN